MLIKNSLYVMRLLPIISFMFGIIIGYLIQFPQKFESFLLFVISGAISGAIVKLIGQWHAELTKRRQEHFNILIDHYLKLHRIPRIEFKDDQSLHIKETLINIPNYENYSNEFNTHLKTGYESVWYRREELDTLIDKHNLSAQQFSTRIDTLINDIKKINPQFIKWDSGPQPLKYYTKSLLSQIISVFQRSYENVIDIDDLFHLISENNQWKINSNHGDLVVSDNENEMKEIKAKIEEGLKNALKSEDFKILKEYHSDIKKKHKLFQNEIDEIIKDVKNGNTLKGNCSKCPKSGIYY